jgi:hypothetical protein
MKPEAHNFLRSRLARLNHELRLIQEKRQQVETDPSLDAERQAIEVPYYDAILRWLLEGVERLEAAIKCVAASPSRRV